MPSCFYVPRVLFAPNIIMFDIQYGQKIPKYLRYLKGIY